MNYADNSCTHKEVKSPEHGYIFSGIAMINGYKEKEHSVFVKSKELFNYRQGTYLQDAFPDMSPQDREFLKTGTMWYHNE